MADAVANVIPPRRARFRYTLPGAWGALIFGCLAFVPSLLPRGAVMQGALCGINAAIGYGLGVLAAWAWRAFADRDVRPTRPSSWRIFLVIGGLAVVGSFLLGHRWQSQIRTLMDVPPASATAQLLLPAVAALFFVGSVAAGRGLHRLYFALARLLHHWIGPRAAKAVGWVVVVGGTYTVVSGLVIGGLADLANQTFSITNDDTQPGVVQPTTEYRTGGPSSLVSWESLGREGRTFMSGGPTATDIAAYSGEPAKEPIRAFAGLETSDDTSERAALAVADLERLGGFDREYLMVATTTGSGWVSPGGADSFEYMVGGDSAIVAIQYSYLPSWISYLVDQRKAREAGRELFDSVYTRWLQLPKDSRPRLIIFGESLGTFGGEAAFSGAHDLANRTSGALLTGPPNFNTLHTEFTGGRDPASLEITPVYRDGEVVRFINSGDRVAEPENAPWVGSRILYIQHPSDPIVWWSPDLILNRPDWLEEPPGPDVLSEAFWIPLVTFWQVSADLPVAVNVPAGHGHHYTTDYVDGWASVLRPVYWTTEKRDELQAIIAPSS
jgi:uncharacterized membrane protein